MAKVDIPDDLYEELEKLIEKNTSVEDYIISVLEGIIREKGTSSKEDEDKVKDRLKDLGYL
jgi:predicted CopG family antitoxin